MASLWLRVGCREWALQEGTQDRKGDGVFSPQCPSSRSASDGCCLLNAYCVLGLGLGHSLALHIK